MFSCSVGIIKTSVVQLYFNVNSKKMLIQYVLVLIAYEVPTYVSNIIKKIEGDMKPSLSSI